MSRIEHPATPGLLVNKSFSQVAIAAGTHIIYTSGQVSIDEQGALVGGNDLEAQTTQAMRNLVRALEAAGATFADVIRTTTYVVGYKPEYRPIIGKVKMPFYPPGAVPTSTLVGVSALALPEWLIEIDAVAVIGKPD